MHMHVTYIHRHTTHSYTHLMHMFKCAEPWACDHPPYTARMVQPQALPLGPGQEVSHTE